jgi:Ca2+-binding EF-hand superfamily protein
MVDYTSLSVTKATKSRFDNQQPDEMGRDEFMQELLDQYDPDVSRDMDSQELINLLKSANEPTDTLEVQELVDELKKTQKLIEKVPDETAEKLGDRYV